MEGLSPTEEGKLAAGRTGDWLLRNEHLSVVIAGQDEDRARSTGSGVILDAAPAGGKDILTRVEISVGIGRLMPVVYDRIGPGSDADSSARVLVAQGHGKERPDLAVETRFRLAPGEDAVEVCTTVENRGSDAAVGLVLGATASWRKARAFVPSLGVGGEGGRKEETKPFPFVVITGGGTGYAWVCPDTSLTGQVTDTGFVLTARTADLPRGQRVRFRQRLVVVGGGAAKAADAAWRIRKVQIGGILARAVDGRGAPVEGTTVLAVDARGRPWARGVTHADGAVALSVPPGRYSVVGSHPYRQGRNTERVRVRAGGARRVVLAFSGPARVRMVAKDEKGRPLAARWTFRSAGRVVLGGKAQMPGQETWVVGPGAMDELLRPGRYHVSVFEGPAYEAWQTDATLGEGIESTLTATLARLPVPAGWIRVDLTAPDSATGDGWKARPRATALRRVDTGFVSTLAGLGTQCNVVAVADGAHPDRFEAAWRDWLASRVEGGTATAVGVGREFSAPTNFVLLDGPAGQASPSAVAEAIQAGRVLVTDGPLIEFTLEGAGPGSVVKTRAGTVSGHIRVTAGRWVEVNRVILLVNGREEAVFPVRGRTRSVRFDEDVDFYLDVDSEVLVRVEGNAASEVVPRLHRASSGFRPMAFTNPIGVVVISDRG